MREQGFLLTKFAQGLRSYSENVFNQDICTECFNLISRPQGLVDRSLITQPFTGIVVDYPFPQFFFGHHVWVMCTRNKIYSISANYGLTLELDLGTPNSPGVWQFADFFDYIILTNGEVTVVTDPTTGVFSSRAADTIMPLLGTVCNFNGQIIASPISTWNGTDSNNVIWSEIGYANFAISESNVAGYRPMPWTGEVYKVMKLGMEYIVVYGSGGIAICKFTNNALGMVKLLKYGIASRGAVGGDDSGHLFIDTSGQVRMLSDELAISDGIYQEFFSPLLGSGFIVAYDALEGDFYITDGTKGFVRSAQGLTEIEVGPTALDINAGLLIGVVEDFDDDEILVTTDSMDFAQRAHKTVDTVEVGVKTDGDVQVAVDYKNNKDVDFESTDWVPVNEEGVAVVPTGGTDFRFKVRCLNSTAFKINHILPRIKFDDNRAKRGKANVSTIVT